MKRTTLAVIVLAAAPLYAAPTLRSALEETLEEFGYPSDTTHIAIVNEGNKVSVNVDLSDSLAKEIMDTVAIKLQSADPALKNLPIELKVMGKTIMDSEPEPLAKAPVEGKKTDRLALLQNMSSQETERKHSSSALALGDGQWTNDSPHSVIVRHLREIKRTGQMYNTITTEEYWAEVFLRANRPEYFEPARDEIAKALAAGLAPYRRGENLTADQFAELALMAIEPKAAKPHPAPAPQATDDSAAVPAGSLAAIDEQLIFKP